jgi:hypothetical protein
MANFQVPYAKFPVQNVIVAPNASTVFFVVGCSQFSPPA